MSGSHAPDYRPEFCPCLRCVEARNAQQPARTSIFPMHAYREWCDCEICEHVRARLSRDAVNNDARTIIRDAFRLLG